MESCALYDKKMGTPQRKVPGFKYYGKHFPRDRPLLEDNIICRGYMIALIPIMKQETSKQIHEKIDKLYEVVTSNQDKLPSTLSMNHPFEVNQMFHIFKEVADIHEYKKQSIFTYINRFAHSANYINME